MPTDGCFLSLSDVGLALKLGEAERAMLLKIPGAKPLQYEPNSPPSKSYVVVPDRMLTDRKALRDWIAKSAAFAKSTAPKPAKRKPSAVRKPRSRLGR
ncbi:MAG TPA: TfoX/Sxy family protein [Rhizomicrobium sp.]|nr:TfoX/Sxy family protein [Rhizomicrobium sp.]